MMENYGVKVLIDTKDDNNHKICDYGYILRRINTHAYEVWAESLQSLFILSPEEFVEINDKDKV